MELEVETKQREELVNVGGLIEDNLQIGEGVVYVFVPHATCGITINEGADSNLPKDISNFLTNLVPQGKWMHDKIDSNGDSHIKTSLIGNCIFVPVRKGKLNLGIWQNIFLCEFDGPRKRKIMLNFVETK